MLNIFKRSLKTGVTTSSYPHEAEESPPAYRGQVTLQPALCTGDGACARVCPSNAIDVTHDDTGWTWQLDNRRCVFCGMCADVCPTGAISITNEFELAARSPADLVTTVRFEEDR